MTNFNLIHCKIKLEDNTVEKQSMFQLIETGNRGYMCENNKAVNQRKRVQLLSKKGYEVNEGPSFLDKFALKNCFSLISLPQIYFSQIIRNS